MRVSIKNAIELFQFWTTITCETDSLNIGRWECDDPDQIKLTNDGIIDTINEEEVIELHILSIDVSEDIMLIKSACGRDITICLYEDR